MWRVQPRHPMVAYYSALAYLQTKP